MLIGYGAIAFFLALVVTVLERTRVRSSGFSDYTTGGRSFGPWFQAMSFLNTWLAGSVFISFAGMVAGGGVIGFYLVFYSLLALALMFFMARPVHVWGKRFDLRTQAELLGFRYGSRAVRRTAGLIALLAAFPWIVLGMQSLGLVFVHLGFGAVPAVVAIVLSILVLSVRQVWTVRMGMRGVVISDMVQGIVAYGVGLVVIVGLLAYLLTHGHGFDAVPEGHFLLPGPGSEAGPLYFFSLVLVGALGGWCWPDVFVRLFTARSTEAIQRSTALSAPILMAFATGLCTVALLGTSFPGVAEDPNAVWFIVASVGGPALVALAGVIVLAATMGNIDALIQASSAQLSNDFARTVPDAQGQGETRLAKVGTAVITLAAAVCALVWLESPALYMLAIVSYAGIVQLGPTLYLGLFWRRGTAVAAVASMVAGIGTAAVLQVLYPTSVPWLGGATSGLVGLVVNTIVYVACAYLLPAAPAERLRVDALFAQLADAEPAPSGSPTPVTAGDEDPRLDPVGR
ncbi:sodium:solute symporter family protein [Citricoccus sp. SGAir0253]|uniref:sodium:solute symporter family protein n=1 Tax=Citricoccus sp. SGAir0253 TaxID=2567881 RepID=UPI0010CCB77F|nr:sodium:solute symporter family protein [Citricoccus sp. SGAir0253]QCU78946.1 sodium:solute symporter family protein [Citricoccus sp. SGAir0253]